MNFSKIASIYKTGFLATGAAVFVTNFATGMMESFSREEKVASFSNVMLNEFPLRVGDAFTKAMPSAIVWPGTVSVFTWRICVALEHNDSDWLKPMTHPDWFYENGEYAERKRREKYRLPWNNPFYKFGAEDHRL